MPPKTPKRATRSGGPPDPAAQPPTKAAKTSQKKNTGAPARTDAERDAELDRMNKGLAGLEASIAAEESAAVGQKGLTARGEARQRGRSRCAYIIVREV